MIYEVAKETVVMSGFVLIMLMDVWAIGWLSYKALNRLLDRLCRKKCRGTDCADARGTDCHTGDSATGSQ